MQKLYSKTKTAPQTEEKIFRPVFDRFWHSFFQLKPNGQYTFTKKSFRTKMIERKFSPLFACLNKEKGQKLYFYFTCLIKIKIGNCFVTMYQLQKDTNPDVHSAMAIYFNNRSFLPEKLPYCLISDKKLKFTCVFCLDNDNNIFKAYIITIPKNDVDTI